VDFGGRADAHLVERMARSMAHRGPDGIDIWAEGEAALAHCMLRTTPESLAERQPLRRDGLVLVMDGRIDNRVELRRALGSGESGESDAELALAAFRRFGADCLARIDGDFALAIWDTARRELFCARDRMGNKPFYYRSSGSGFAFASELPALLVADAGPRQVNEDVLVEYLAGEWYSMDETMWVGCMRLPRAHRLVATSAGARTDEYWRPDPAIAIEYRDEEQYFEHYRELLTRRVAVLSRTHGTAAFEVSGGLDSSAVFCIAQRLYAAGRLPAADLAVFTATFAHDATADEVTHARTVAAATRVPLTEVPGREWPLEAYAASARRRLDFPGFPNGESFTDLRIAVAASGSRVLLTGESGDLWLDGWPAHYADTISRGLWGDLGRSFRADVAAMGTRRATRELLRHGVFPLLPPAVQESIRSLLSTPRPQARPLSWLAPAMRARLERLRERSLRRAADSRHPGQEEILRAYDSAFTYQCTERIELSGATAGIEVRHPFGDAAILQFMLAIPAHLRIRGGVNKYIHVKALEGIVPASVLGRRDKADFTAIVQRAILGVRGELEAMRRPEWLAEGAVAELFEALGDGSRVAWPVWVLWGIFACDLLVREAHGEAARLAEVAPEPRVRYV